MGSSLKDDNITAWPKLGVNYWGITKCGNTTVKTHLYELEFSTRVVENKHIRIHGYEAINYINAETALSNGLLNFAVTRDPYSRFMSMYNDIILSRPKRAEKAGVGSVKTVNELLNYLEESDLSTVDVHFKTQSSFIPIHQFLTFDIKQLSHWPLAISPITKCRHASKVKTLARLTEHQRERIYNLYRIDFENFNYLK